MALNIPLLCLAALGLLTIALGFFVSMQRGKSGTIAGYPNDPTSALYKAVRAHGNTTEYAPVLMVLIYALSQHPLSAWVLWSIIGATICRYSIAFGLLLSKSLAKPHPLRFIGALGTYLFGFALCFAVIQQSLLA